MSNNQKLILTTLTLVAVILGLFFASSTINWWKPAVGGKATPAPAAQFPQANFTLKDVSGGKASGDGNWSFKDNLFTFAIRAQGLADPGPGKFYEAWFLDGGPVPTQLAGKFTQVKGDYVLGFQGPQNLSFFKKVAVSLETKDDQTMEKKILEGPTVNK